MTVVVRLGTREHDNEVVLNRARLYHDRRDFHIQCGDTGTREEYPRLPYWMQQNDTDDVKEQIP